MVEMAAINENTKFDNTDFRNIVPRFSAEKMKANQNLVEKLGRIAEKKNVTRAQIALATRSAHTEYR